MNLSISNENEMGLLGSLLSHLLPFLLVRNSFVFSAVVSSTVSERMFIQTGQITPDTNNKWI